MKVWIVMTDLAGQYAPSADLRIEKVFASEADALAFAKEDIHREVEAHDVIASAIAVGRCETCVHAQPDRHSSDVILCSKITDPEDEPMHFDKSFGCIKWEHRDMRPSCQNGRHVFQHAQSMCQCGDVKLRHQVDLQ